MIVFILIFILVYILSAYFLWLWIHKAYSKGGIYDYQDVDGEDFIFMFCPVVNFCCCIYSWLLDNPSKKNKNNNDNNLNKFFKIKK